MPTSLRPGSVASRLVVGLTPGTEYNQDDLRKVFGAEPGRECDLKIHQALQTLRKHGMKRLARNRYVWDPDDTYVDPLAPEGPRTWTEVVEQEGGAAVVLRTSDGRVWIARPL